MIPYGRQAISDSDIAAVVEVLKSDYLTTGPQVEMFEKSIASYLNVKHVIAISNGTAALHAACFVAGIGPGDEVIVPAITFAASSNAVLYCGGTPVFVDIDPDTWNIDPKSIRERITSNTKAIIPVHYTGLPCDMSSIMEIAREFNLKVIEDGAHVLGAEVNGKIIGCTGDMMTLSFHPVKHITTGEGGAIVTNDDELATKLRAFRTHGIVRGGQMNAHQDEAWYYEQHFLGYNYRITDFQCALGNSQLKRLPDFLRRRREIAHFYNEKLGNVEGLRKISHLRNDNSSYHLYVIQLDLVKLNIDRKAVFDLLREHGIGVNVHYIPVYYHPYYRELGYQKGLCPVAERVYEEIISIPIYPDLTESDLIYIVSTIKRIISENLVK